MPCVISIKVVMLLDGLLQFHRKYYLCIASIENSQRYIRLIFHFIHFSYLMQRKEFTILFSICKNNFYVSDVPRTWLVFFQFVYSFFFYFLCSKDLADLSLITKSVLPMSTEYLKGLAMNQNAYTVWIAFYSLYCLPFL